MTDAEKIRALVAYRMDQAADALRAARTLIDAGLPRDAVNRAYYAIFYSMLALLVTRRLGTSKHSGALLLFSREFIKPGLLPPEMDRLARRAFERRLEADYAELAEFSMEEAEETFTQATSFVEHVRASSADSRPEGLSRRCLGFPERQFEIGNRLLTAYARKVAKECVKGIAGGKMLDEDLDGHPGSGKDERPIHDLRVTRDDLLPFHNRAQVVLALGEGGTLYALVRSRHSGSGRITVRALPAQGARHLV